MSRCTALTLCSLLLALAGGCATAVPTAAPTDFPREESVAVPAAAPTVAAAVPLEAGNPARRSAGLLEFRGAVDLTGIEGIGGLSGLSISADGRRFTAVGDTGLVATGRLDYDPAGTLLGAGDLKVRPLPVEEGFTRKKRRTDAEELVRVPDRVGGGGWLVSLERDHRILWYAGSPNGPDGKPAAIALPPGVEEESPENGGLEALTILSDGRLLTIEEGEEPAVPEHRAWTTAAPFDPRGSLASIQWRPFTYMTAPRYRPVGAAGLADGGTLVLERRFSLLGGVSSRLALVSRAALEAGGEVHGKELLRLERPLLNDNFEGVAARRGDGGETLIYLVSDDNFNALQRTYLAVFALPAAESR